MKGPFATFVGLGVLLLLLIVGLTPNSLLAAIAAVVLAVGLTLLVGIGPEKMGIGLMVLGMVPPQESKMSRTGRRNGTCTSVEGSHRRPDHTRLGRPVRTFDTATSARGSGPLRGAWSAWSRTRTEA